MQHTIPHGLDHAQALMVTQKALDSYQARFTDYRPQQRWVNQDRAEIQFTVAGKTLKGYIQVQPKDIALDLDVPLLFAPFRGRALKIIEEEIEGWIRRAKAGELG